PHRTQALLHGQDSDNGMGGTRRGEDRAYRNHTPGNRGPLVLIRRFAPIRIPGRVEPLESPAALSSDDSIRDGLFPVETTLPAHPPAVDHQYRAVHVIRGLRRQKHHRSPEILRLAPPPG